MIETRAQAEALHAAIETRDDAWNRFHNAALMPANQTPDERLVQTANNWVAAERAVEELGHGVALVQTDGLPEPGAATEGGGTTAAATVKPPAKRRGRPPKAATTKAPVEPPVPPRTEEEVRAGDGSAEDVGGAPVGPADPAAAEAAAQAAKGGDGAAT